MMFATEECSTAHVVCMPAQNQQEGPCQGKTGLCSDIPASGFEMPKELPAAAVLHGKVHALLVLEASQQLDDKGELHQPQNIPFRPQMLCLLHKPFCFRVVMSIQSQVEKQSPCMTNRQKFRYAKGCELIAIMLYILCNSEIHQAASYENHLVPEQALNKAGSTC